MAQSANPSISILIAEDSRVQARLLEGKLEQAGYQTVIAENGAVALERIRQQRPDLVITDIEMPEMTGYELCHAIKTDAAFRSIPVILLSTLSDPQDVIEGLRSGADNYVTKPYDPDYLLARVRDLLATPVTDEHPNHEQLNVHLGGKDFSIQAGRQQVLNLLISTFENAVEKNRELMRSNEALSDAKAQLQEWNDRLEQLNQRMTRDLHAAAKVQQSLLPRSLPRTERIHFAWKYFPCDELAGDFLNFFLLDDRHLAAFVVDVSGHGVASSLLAVAIGRLLSPQASATSLLIRPGDDKKSLQVTPPIEVAAELNRRFPMEEQNGLYFTMTYGVLDLETLRFDFVGAGHPPIIHQTKTGQLHMVKSASIAVGWVPDMPYEAQSVQLDAGDRLFLYSDGIPEAMDAELNQFGDRRMLEVLELGKQRPLEATVDLLSRSVQRWCHQKGPRDDVSILGLEIIK